MKLLSAIVPCYNEEENVPYFYEEFMKNEDFFKKHELEFELWYIDDGSRDKTAEEVKKLILKDKRVHLLSFSRNFGKEAALYAGLEKVSGDYVACMDADLQDSPDEIPELYRMIKEDGYDLVSGYKQKRYDPISKTIPTKLFNATARKISGIKNLHDFNCGLKAYRREVVKHIEVYGDMHRYIPYLAKNAGYTKIGERVVHHQARKYGVTKFGLDRFVNGYLDLLTLWFQTKFGKKPMHFFGLLGSLMFFFGLIAVMLVGGIKLYNLYAGNHPMLVTQSPYFYLSLVCMILGVQLFLCGFLGELIIRHSADRNVYEISEEIKK